MVCMARVRGEGGEGETCRQVAERSTSSMHEIRRGGPAREGSEGAQASMVTELEPSMEQLDGRVDK